LTEKGFVLSVRKGTSRFASLGASTGGAALTRGFCSYLDSFGVSRIRHKEESSNSRCMPFDRGVLLCSLEYVARMASTRQRPQRKKCSYAQNELHGECLCKMLVCCEGDAAGETSTYTSAPMDKGTSNDAIVGRSYP
jgi:hypothetical protein